MWFVSHNLYNRLKMASQYSEAVIQERASVNCYSNKIIKNIGYFTIGKKVTGVTNSENRAQGNSSEEQGICEHIYFIRCIGIRDLEKLYLTASFQLSRKQWDLN